MSENAVVRARVDRTTKAEASAVLAGMGLSLSDAFRLLLKRVSAEKTLPFELHLLLGYAILDNTATATKKSFASFLQKRRLSLMIRA